MRSWYLRALVGLGAVMSLGMAFPATSAPVPSGGFSSDNVEWQAGLPAHSGTSGGILHDGYYHVTDPRGVYVYDVAEPADPQLVGSLPAAQTGTHAVFAQEEPDTNGEILLVNAIDAQEPSTSARLLVVDVGDKDDLSVIGSLDVTDHTWTCVLDCSYAYGRDGDIVDLTDPTAPKETGVSWRKEIVEEGAHDGYAHDFTEVAPGRLIAAGQPTLYLDATDPLHPVELTRIKADLPALGYHGAVWPNDATDPLLLMGAEVGPAGATRFVGSGCDDDSTHAVASYDASEVIRVDERQFNGRDEQAWAHGTKEGHAQQRERAEFRPLEQWRVDGRGAYADGNAPAHVLYCGHWFDAHPQWDAGGYLAMGHYDWGTRFLQVDGEGRFEEVGWFQPVGGYTASAYWITDDVVYVHDYRRGIDILRVDGLDS